MQSAQAAGCFYSVLQRAKRMILSVEKLSHSYGVRTLFKDVTFNIEMGDKIGIIGVNGTGKSCCAILHAVKPVTAAGLRQMAAV